MAGGELGTYAAKLMCDLTDLKNGLQVARTDFAAFRSNIETGVQKVKDILRFAGVAVGLYELTSQIKTFGQSILEEGGKLEVLRASAEAVGSYYKLSAASLEFYLQKLREKGILEENSLKAVNSFLKAGLSIDFLPQLADAAKVLGASMGMPLQEAFDAIISGIVKGTPKQLAEMVPGIKQVLQSMSSETGKLLDSNIISGTEKSEIMMNAVLAMADKLKGSVDQVSDSYFAKLNEYKVKVAEVKEALFELVKPIGMAVTQAEIKSWDDFYLAIGNNKAALHDLGETVAVYVGRFADFVRNVVSFTAAHKDLLSTLLQLALFGKLAAYIVSIGTALTTVIPKIITATIAITGLEAACTGNFAIIITVALGGVLLAINQIRKLHGEIDDLNQKYKETHGPITRPGEPVQWPQAAEVGARGQISPELLKNLQTAQPQEDQGGEIRQRLEEIGAGLIPAPRKPAGVGPQGQLSPELMELLRLDANEAQAKKEADTGAAQGKAEHALPPGSGKGGKGGGAADDFLGEYLKMLEAKRQADLQDAQNSLDLLKSTDDKKKAELELALAAQEIDGRTYYQRLQELQQGETTQALALIEQKRQAQLAAYQESLAQLDNQDLSPEAREIAQQRLAAENRKALSVLDADAAKLRLEGETKITNELKRQVEVRREYQEKIVDLNIETDQLLGAITEQEAKLQRLVSDWRRAKQAAIEQGGYTPEYAAALERNYQAKVGDVKYGEQFRSLGSEFSSGITNLVNDIRKGSVDVGNALVEMFNNIEMAALKPGFDALGQALTSAVKWLLNSLSTALGGGNPAPAPGGGEYMDWTTAYYGGGYARGGAFWQGSPVSAYASGGVVTRPTLFPMASGQGLMGEAGPEGILPLARVGGDLGVKALLPQTGPPQVNIINQTGVEAQGQASMKDDGSLDIILEKKVTGYAARGPLNQLIRTLIKQG